MKFKSLAVILLVGAVSSADASSLVCFDTEDDVLSYNRRTSDGGFARYTSESLVFQNVEWIRQTPLNEEGDFRKALMNFGSEKERKVFLKTETKDKNFEILLYTVPLTVREIAGDESPQRVLFRGKVFCKEMTYTGVPRP